jgi:hypothetical protein
MQSQLRKIINIEKKRAKKRIVKKTSRGKISFGKYDGKNTKIKIPIKKRANSGTKT